MIDSPRPGDAISPARLAKRLAIALLACATGLAAAYAIVRPNPGRRLIPVRRSLDQRYHDLVERAKLLEPLHAKKGAPGRGDWLASHHEAGQPPDQYVRGDAILPEDGRRTIYVQPLGEFTPEREEILDLATEFLGLYFCLPAKKMETLDDAVVPSGHRRFHGRAAEQLSTSYLIEQVLVGRLPEDAMLLSAFTAKDLWPGQANWNFVFGQASLFDRVGVWSLHRFGDPKFSGKARMLALRRSLKLAAHESGHMFGLHHCTAYECCMGGSNSMEESDRAPLALCPECVVKVAWATGADLEERYESLRAFCERNGLVEETDYYAKALGALRSADNYSGSRNGSSFPPEP